MFSYAGKILRINLTTGKVSTEPLREEMAKNYIGGIGLGIRLLMDNSKAGTDPFDPDNPLIYVTGPLSGTMGPTAGNGYAVVSKSPATGGVGEAKAHGFFGPDLKRAGYDAVIITGKANKLSYLWIDDDKVEIKDAEFLTHQTVYETDVKIREELGDYYVRVSAIGEAGEKLCRFAAIINDEFRAIGRCGMGAVMGSKNLKAIAVRGTHDIVPAKPDEFMDMVREYHERMKGPATQKYRTLGTVENLLINNSLHCLPTRNYSNAHFEDADKVSGETINEKYVAKIIGCNSCAMRCEHEVVIPEGPYKGTMTRLDYDALWALGPYCGISKLDAIVKGMSLCNYYGMDATSAGVTVAFAMDCYENGLLSQKDFDGAEAQFGSSEALIQILTKMGNREGIGEVLADGVKLAAQKIGKGADKLAQHIKGLEVTGYDLRCLKTAALGYAVSFRGADHDRHGVGHGIAHRSDGVRGARTGRDHAHPNPAAGPGITRRHEARALLIGGHDQRDGGVAGLVPVLVVITKHRIVGGQDGAATVAKDGPHAHVHEDLHDHLGAGHPFAGERVGRRFGSLGARGHRFRIAVRFFPSFNELLPHCNRV